MPRGVPNPAIREDLLAAAERLLLTRGPRALSGRAITREAGCATGALYNYFDSVDDLLAQGVARVVGEHDVRMRALVTRAGTGTVGANLVAAATDLADERSLAMAALSTSRPEIAHRVRTALSGAPPEFAGLASSVGAYLRAEQSLGRVRPDADPDAAGIILVAAVHHLLLTGGARSDGSDVRADVDTVVRTLVAGLRP